MAQEKDLRVFGWVGVLKNKNNSEDTNGKKI